MSRQSLCFEWFLHYFYRSCRVSRASRPSFVLIDGRLFNITTDGVKRRSIKWPDADQSTGWLVFANNTNARIESVAELFTSVTFQPKTWPYTALRSLEQYDLPENGGNGDGLISRDDAAYRHLKAWFDKDKDGHSNKSELVALNTLAVDEIPLKSEPDADGCLGERDASQHISISKICITTMSSIN